MYEYHTDKVFHNSYLNFNRYPDEQFSLSKNFKAFIIYELHIKNEKQFTNLKKNE